MPDWLTNQPSNCVQQSSSWEVIRSAASQETPTIYETRRIMTPFTGACHKRISLSPRPFAVCLNVVSFFYAVESLAPRSPPPSLSGLRNFLLGILAATLHIWKSIWAPQGKCRERRSAINYATTAPFHVLPNSVLAKERGIRRDVLLLRTQNTTETWPLRNPK